MQDSTQSKQRFAHVRVDLADGRRIQTGQFTLFDFVDRCFSFSAKRKQLAVQILTRLAEKPARFTALLAETGVQKSSLHLTLTALEQSGLIQQERRGDVFELSGAFGSALEAYAGFWKSWKEKNNR